MRLIAEEPEQTYRRAERRLHGALLGDGQFVAGIARGEDTREFVARELRKMRRSFEAAISARDKALAEAGARATALEEELQALAARKARGARRRKSTRPTPESSE